MSEEQIRNDIAALTARLRAMERSGHVLVRPANRVLMEATIRRIELVSNLSFGGTATARELQWVSGSGFKRAGGTFAVHDPFSKFQQTAAPKDQGGARGYARQFTDRVGYWELIELQHQARWIAFVVNDEYGFDTGDTSVTVDGVVYHDGYEIDTGKRCTPSNVEIGDIFTLTCEGQTVQFEATEATVANVTAGLTAAWNNSEVAADEEITATDEGAYVRLVGTVDGEESVDFDLTSDAINGPEGKDDTQTLATTSQSAITIVYNHLCNPHADPNDFFYLFGGDDDARGTAIYSPENVRYAIVSCEGGFCRCTAKLKGALASADSTATVDNVNPIHGADPTADSGTELTVYNTHDWDGDNNADCRIEYNKTTEHWELYQVDCPA